MKIQKLLFCAIPVLQMDQLHILTLSSMNKRPTFPLNVATIADWRQGMEDGARIDTCLEIMLCMAFCWAAYGATCERSAVTGVSCESLAQLLG